MVRKSVRLSGLSIRRRSRGVAVVWAQASLGTAQAFAVLGGFDGHQHRSDRGRREIWASARVRRSPAFPPGTSWARSTQRMRSPLQAQVDVTTQYNALADAPCTADLTGQDLGGHDSYPRGLLLFVVGSADRSPDAQRAGKFRRQFIFKIGSTLTTASGSSVLMIDGGNPCGVAGRSAAPPPRNDHVFHRQHARTDEHHVEHRREHHRREALARNGAVTLDTNNITFATCAVVGPIPPVPTLSTWAMIVLTGLLALAGFATLRKRQSL